ncbi:MAG TPA: molybdenum cofactor guanylyltransferase [Terriglobales bacterium]|jgi:molybdopterin-guanine dinucleotide biosynthesis protein A
MLSEMISVSAYVLAGGKSSRMGQDKAFLVLGGCTLLERALGSARTVAENVAIVGDPAKFAAYGQVIEDVYRERGPLGGIHAALSNTSTEWNLILGVDLPFVNADFLCFLISAAKSCDAVVIVPSTVGGYEPLCAVYRKEFAAVAESALKSGRNKIDALYASVSLRTVNADEIAAHGFRVDMFRNLNAPADWDLAKTEFENASKHL